MYRIANIAISIVFLICAIWIQESFPHKPLKENQKFEFNDGFASFDSDFLHALSFGYPKLVSGMLWLRFLQHTPPTAMKDDEVSWIFLDLFAASQMDPEFSPIHSHGAMFMSVITEDIKGSTILLEEGVKKYPKFWRYRAYLAYHYEHNLNDRLKAAKQYDDAALLPGAPYYFKALAATMYEKANAPPLYAIKVVKRMLDAATREDVKIRLKEKLAKLEARIEKDKPND